MASSSTVRIAAIAAFIGFVVSGGVVASLLNASVGRHRLAYTEIAEDGDPPEVGVGIAMGAFRGLFVNYLWMRANQLKMDGQYFEAIELSDAITRLQPRFPRVWIFHAWNMAYNISVATRSQDERWQWVTAGIRLLRDDAIRKNPNDLLLHKELAWIFVHKMQGITDDANQYYKQRLASEWTVILGPPPMPEPGDPSKAGAVRRYIEWLTPVRDAPDTWEELVELTPEAEVVRQLARDAVGEEARIDTLRRWTLDVELHRLELGHEILNEVGPNNLAFAQATHRFPELRPAWEAWIAFLRKQELVEGNNMDPARMIRYIEKYGPLDWRHAGAHALYWARTGVEKNLSRATTDNIKDFDFLNTDRIVVQSIQELFRSGEIYFDFLAFNRGEYSYYLAIPTTHYVDGYWDAMRESRERSDERGEVFQKLSKRVYTSFSAGFQNFISDAILFFYRRGQIEKAEEYQGKLRTWPGLNQNDSALTDRLALPLSEFVEEEMKDRADSPTVASNQVVAALQGAFVGGLLGGDMELFNKQYNYARQFHRYYLDKQLRDVIVGGARTRMEVFRRDFAGFAGEILYTVIAILDPMSQRDIYAMAPIDLQRSVYYLLEDLAKPNFDTRAAGSDSLTFDEMFPKPEGFDAYKVKRRQAEQERVESRSLDVERQ
ncbi:MAG: hypothetical protein AAF108_00165 [Planctomycetota bacterium]